MATTTTGTNLTPDIQPPGDPESPDKKKKRDKKRKEQHWPRNPATGSLMPVDPIQGYTILQVAEYFGASHKFISETFIRWHKAGKDGVIYERRLRPGRTRCYSFMRIKGSAIIAWERERGARR